MSEEKKEKEAPAPHSPEGMIAYINKWEHDHLRIGDVKLHNQEYGMVSAAMRAIGERMAKRMVSASTTKCGSCGKPIEGTRVFKTIPVFDAQLGNHVNKYACSSACAAKLEDTAHKQAVELQTGQ